MNFGTSPNWDRAFYAARFDAPLCATAIISAGHVSGILPPVGTHAALVAKLKDRCERPFLRPGERR